MRHTTTALLAAACLALAGGAVGCSKSYDDIVKDCTQALKDRPKGDKGKPDACKDVKQDDYDALLMQQILKDQGWVDDDGNVDQNKMLDDATAQP